MNAEKLASMLVFFIYDEPFKMKLKIVNDSLFNLQADAIILSIDGYGAGMGGRAARKFEELYPELWKTVESKINYPIKPGNFYVGMLPVPAPYQYIYLASVLSHLPAPSDIPDPLIFNRAFLQIIHDAAHKELSSIITGLPTGGWRNDPLNSFIGLSEVIDKSIGFTRKMELILCILEPDICEKIVRYAKNTGYILY